jgi:MFS family permease
LAIWPDLGGYFVGLALLGFGSGLLDVAPGAIVGDIVEGRGGPVFAAYSMSSDVGTVLGPVVAGRIADASYSDAFGATAAILGVAALIAAFSPETLHRGADPDGDPVLSPLPDGGTSATTTT